MADPADLMNAWQDAIRDVGGTAASLVSGPAELANEVFESLQGQAKQLEQVLQRQLDFEQDLVTRALAPARVMLDVVDQATAAYQAQARAFRTTSASFAQLAELMDQQAELIQRASETLRDPVTALRSAVASGNGEAELEG